MTPIPTNNCCAPSQSVAGSERGALLPNLQQLVMRIEKMDCPTEEGLIRKKLGGMPGVDQLDFNLMQRRLTVHHHSPYPEAIVAAVTSLGMDAIVEKLTETASSDTKTVFTIQNMDCPTEEALIRNKLSTMNGITSLDFNLIKRKLTVIHTLSELEPIQSALDSIGMQALREDAALPSDHVTTQEPLPVISRKKWWMMGIGGVAAFMAEIVAWTTANENSWLVIALALFAIAVSGTETYKKGWIALSNRILNINALMTIAVTGALLIKQWPEAAMVMVLFTIAEMIEALSLDRARNAIHGLMALTPDVAKILQPDGSWNELKATAVQVGMTARIGPGERIALDGELTSGQSSVNQAPITGESMPVSKSVGDKVFAGTINETGSFDYRVTAAQTNSTLSRIIRAVEEAQGNKSPTQRFVDRFAALYTPIVFAVALAIALVPPLAFGLPWMDWIYKALVLLVIACPCALVISTPVTVVSGLAAAAKVGILIKGGVYLEQGHKLKVLALDKTGTITLGKPEVTDVVSLFDDSAIGLRLAAMLAQRSDHPVSAAVSTYWKLHENGSSLDEVADFEAITGRGVKGRINGQWYFLGNHRLVEELGICNIATETVLHGLEADGKTVVVICNESAPLAVIAVADTVRETSRQAIAELHALGVRTLMLTGDNELTAKAIAGAVGIDDARGNLLPEDKLAIVSDALEKYGTVGMVGDGINDTPALAKASIGFAMGAAGTDTALETADVALMDDDLRKIPQFIQLSAKAARILRQNIVIALSIKAVFLGLAFMGVATLWMAVFADMGASLIVVFNGLRLLRKNPAAIPGELARGVVRVPT
jgi:Cd2+/Zn2+-exporting ATPase